MASSLQSKIDDLEARFKAESFEDSTRSRPSESQLGAKPYINNVNPNLNSPFRKGSTGILFILLTYSKIYFVSKF